MGIVETADITAEALIAAAPDVLLVTEDGLASVGGLDGLVALPSLAATPAAQHRAVLAYDAQLMLGNGPRTGDFLAQLMLDLTDIRARLDDTNTDADTTETDNTDTDTTDTDKETP
jgi:iron complex transport system substrate-binding protein